MVILQNSLFNSTPERKMARTKHTARKGTDGAASRMTKALTKTLLQKLHKSHHHSSQRRRECLGQELWL